MIPKIIHMTCKDKNNLNNQVWEKCLSRYKELQKDYEIRVYDNNDIYKIIEKYDPKNLDFVKSIKVGAILADLFRYLIIYLYGGIYSDMDCYLNKDINQLFTKTHYHGDSKNTFSICKNNTNLFKYQNNCCNNCKLIDKNSYRETYKCNGHRYINENHDIIVGEELGNLWTSHVLAEDKNFIGYKHMVCQWFLISKPKQKFFKRCYKECLKSIKEKMNNLDKNNYLYEVVSMSGPLFFTRMVDNEKDAKIVILPEDFFCHGSWTVIPKTENSYISHQFTASWLK